MAGLSPMHENSPRALHLNPFRQREQFRDENGDQMPSLFLVDDRLDCNWNNRRRPTLVMLGERTVSSQTSNLRSHRLRRNWLRPNVLIAFSSLGPRGNSMATSGIKGCCTLLLQMFAAYLQFIGRQYSTTEQDPVIFFETKDLVFTRDWKAVSAALDRNQPTTKFGQGLLGRSRNPITDRSSGIGPRHGIEP
jgi:hypothetical protein